MRIFVAGLSKSGKTTRSLGAAEQIPEIEYVSVSRLLKAAGCVLPVATLAEGLANQQTAIRSSTAMSWSRRTRDRFSFQTNSSTGSDPVF